MGDKTGIEWTDATWNPLAGCSVVSPGCTNCYAMKEAARLERMGGKGGAKYAGLTKPSKAGPVWTGEVRLHQGALSQPLRWGRPRRIFVNSMSDLFHESVPDEAIDRVFVVMALAAHHTFQVLTKRSARMRAYIAGFSWERAVESCRGDDGASVIPRHSIDDLRGAFGFRPRRPSEADRSAWPVANVWLGVSVEDQRRADERIPDLLCTMAAVRFVSMEPLLGPVDLAESVALWARDELERRICQGKQPAARDGKLDWVITGGESGPGARPTHPEWFRAIRDQCAAAGVAYLHKQNGEWGTGFSSMSTGAPVFRRFETFDQWVNKASTWVNGGICLDVDGRRLEVGADFMAARDAGKFPVTIMHRVGKKASGRLLDGVLHDGYPAAAMGTQSLTETLTSG